MRFFVRDNPQEQQPVELIAYAVDFNFKDGTTHKGIIIDSSMVDWVFDNYKKRRRIHIKVETVELFIDLADVREVVLYKQESEPK